MAATGLKVFGALSGLLLVLLVFAYTLHSGDLSFVPASMGVEPGRGTREQCGPTFREMTRLSKTLVEQRNEIAAQLNKKQQKLGQIACEQLKSGPRVSKTGGWCKNSSKEGGGQHVTDKPLAAALAKFFTGKSVASFGDGPGRYKQLILDRGMVKSYESYDGAPYAEETSEGRVKFLDLTLMQFGLPLYDWILSLEVAEHIPREFESVYIDNIVRHAREGVVISWAVPGQGGYSHINNRPLEYVIKLFDELGFSYDDSATTELQKKATFQWLKKNTSVFRRRENTAIAKDSTYFT